MGRRHLSDEINENGITIYMDGVGTGKAVCQHGNEVRRTAGSGYGHKRRIIAAAESDETRRTGDNVRDGTDNRVRHNKINPFFFLMIKFMEHIQGKRWRSRRVPKYVL